jgi:hypothetical protein
MAGAILIVLAMLLAFPPLVFFLGMLISALIGTASSARTTDGEQPG